MIKNIKVDPVFEEMVSKYKVSWKFELDTEMGDPLKQTNIILSSENKDSCNSSIHIEEDGQPNYFNGGDEL